MKRKTLILTLLLFVVPLFAKGTKGYDYFNQSSKMKFGLYIGAVGASEYGYDAKNKNIKPGGTSGITIFKNIANNLHLRFGIYYTQKGYRNRVAKGNDNNKEVTIYTLHSNYMEFPFGFQFFMPVNKYQTNWVIGFCPAYNLNAKTRMKKNGKSQYTTVEDIRPLDFGLICGTNLMIFKSINLDLTTNIGLISIINTANPPSLKNITVSLSLGYFL